MAYDYAYRAKRCLREAELAQAEADCGGVIRRSQEALELALKALLRYHGIEYPREHDVSDALEALKGRVDSSVEEMLQEAAELSSELSKQRGPAMYGYEREGIPPSRLFNARYAGEVLVKVSKIVTRCTAELS